MKRHKYYFAAGHWILAIYLILGSGFWGLPRLYAQDKIIAIVNEEAITQKDWDDFLNFTKLQLKDVPPQQRQKALDYMKENLLNRLIDDKLILQEAKKNKITIDDARIKGRIDEIRRQFPTDAEFRSSLAEQGLTQADLESRIRDQMLMHAVVDAMVRSKISIKPSEITEYYLQNKSQFLIPQQWEFESIALDFPQMAKDVSMKLGLGESLDQLAEKYGFTVNKITVVKGGQLRKELEDVIFDLKPQVYSVPIKLDDKYYIFKLIRIIPPKQQSLAEAQDKINALLMNNKMSAALETWLDKVKKDSYIDVFERN